MRHHTTVRTRFRPSAGSSGSTTVGQIPRLHATVRLLPGVVLLTVFALLLGSAPSADADPKPSPPSSPTPPQAAPAAPPADGSQSDAAAIRIETPTSDTLVSGQPLTARVWTAAGASKFTATLGGKNVTSSFRRVGRNWVGLIGRVPAGRTALGVSVVVGGTVRRAFTRLTVKGKTADLVSVVGDRSGLLKAMSDPGVKSIAVRVDAASTATASLNGKAVPLSRPSSGTVRSLVLSVGDGLRPGDNVLIVQAYRPDGTWESMRVAFVIPRGVPLAEAGAGVDAREGESVVLNGSGSKAGSATGRLTYRWQLLQSPAGAGASALAASGSRASLTMTKPGQYVAKLTVTERQGGKLLRSSDLTVLDALAGVPPMGDPLTTYDPQTDGLTIGDTTVSWDTYFAGKLAGVYAFNSRSLMYPLVDGQALLPRALSSDDPDGDLTAFLKLVPQNAIVVVVGKDGCCAKSSLLPRNGPFSHIVAYSGATTPGNFADGSWNRGQQFGDGVGAPGAAGVLSGYLRYQTGEGSDASSGSYRFVQTDNVRFATSVPSIATGSANDGAVYRVGAPDGGAAIAVTDGDQNAVRMQPKTGGLDQQWQLVRAYGESYRLINRDTGTCLALSADAASVVSTACSDSSDPNVLWILVGVTNSASYYLRSATTAQSASPQVLSRSDDGDLTTTTLDASAPNQQWSLDIPPGLYSVTAQQTGQAMAEPDYQSHGGDQLVSLGSTGELRQQWRLLDRPDGKVALQNLASSLCAAVSSAADNAAVVRSSCAADQQGLWWTPLRTVAGLYLQAQGTNLNLAVAGGKLVVQHYDSLNPVQPVWSLNRRSEPVGGGYYSLAGAGTGRSVQALDNGQVAARPASAPVPGQDWQLQTVQAPGLDDYVTIVNPRLGKCLNNTGQSVSVGDCVTEGATSLWRVMSQPDGTYTVQASFDLTLVLTAQADGSLAIAKDAGGANQRWLFAGSPVSFEVGPRRMATALPAGGTGFGVLATDTAARPLDGYPKLYVTNGASGSSNAQNALANDLKQLGGTVGVSVLVQSIGRPKPNSLAWNAIADGVEAIGGDKLSALSLNGSGDFAVAGCGKMRRPADLQRVRPPRCRPDRGRGSAGGDDGPRRPGDTGADPGDPGPLRRHLRQPGQPANHTVAVQ